MTDDAAPAPARGQDWFDDLFRAHAVAVHRYFLRRVPRDDVEDLTADVLATAWRRRSDVPAGHELPWLYRTAGFVLANHRRKARPVPVQDVPDDGWDGPDPGDAVVADAEVREVLAALTARDRHVLLLHAWEGLDGEQLAHALGITRGGAAAALSRARASLRTAWQARVGV